MSDMNDCKFIGTISRTPEIRHIGNEKTVANFSILTTKKRNGSEFKSYHKIQAWNALAGKCKHLCEGDRVFVQGELQTRSYDKDGAKVWITEVNAWHVEALLVIPAAPRAQTVAPKEEPQANNEQGYKFDDGESDELPF